MAPFGPLIETKLYVPRQRRAVLARPRLSERLSRAAEAALTLVSAPAGFGKTTVLTEWLAAVPADGRSAAWVSLDERDNDPALFWTYVVVALRMAVGGDIAAGAVSLLESSQAPIEIVLATLLNDLRAVSGDVVLVLDDYHVIEAREVHEEMAFLLEHLPSNVHLVIATRADPPLSLARLRGDGELVEIRATDLRFTPEESVAYLRAEMGSVLTEGDVAALEARTEGWIAALQLAALSMRGRDDVASFTVYRRRPSKADLVADATRAHSEGAVPIPDTGSLHGDLRARQRHRNNLGSEVGGLVCCMAT